MLTGSWFLMTRPKKPVKEVKLVTAIRLRPATKAALQKAASANGRSMGNWIERVIEEKLREEGFLK
jgi:hypothetical protein